MKVRIQLMRDDGNLVLEMAGNAASTMSWGMPESLGWAVLENGATMAGFTYKPFVRHMIDMTDQEREALFEDMARMRGDEADDAL